MSEIATRKVRRRRRPAEERAGHGTWTFYSRGCRCEACSTACTEYGRLRRKAKKDGVRFVPPAHLLAPERESLTQQAPEGSDPLVYRRYNYRVTVAPAVMRRLVRAFGSARFVYNEYIALARREHAAGRKHPSAIDGVREVVTCGRQRPETAWLQDVPAVLLASSVRDGATAYDNFFNSVTRVRKGPRIGYPRFKKRNSRQSITFPKGSFSINGGYESTNGTGGRVWLSKIGYVNVNWHRPLPAEPSAMKVIQERDGSLTASFLVQIPKPIPKGLTRQPRSVGVDLGLTDYASIVYSDGNREKIENPRYLRSAEKKLARLQRDLSRKKKGSKNRAKARVKLARAYDRMREQRLNHARQLVAKLIRENQSISVETLRVSGMMKNRRLAKSIADASWTQFMTLLEQQAIVHGRTLFQADPFFPSSQLCSICGERTGKKPLEVRQFSCPHCQSWLDRDFNAATNLLIAAGPAEIQNACGRKVRLQLAGVLPSEAGTYPKSGNLPGEKEALAQECAKAEACS